MPGVYALGDYDLAGFIVGMVPPGLMRDPKEIRAGDLLIGLPSSGLHTNGFSLVRKVFEGVPLNRMFPELGRPLGEELLEPHRSYLQELGSIAWKGAAHITGGGIYGNLPRCLPDGLGARLGRRSWVEPAIFELVRKRGRITDDEMFGTFNMGLGMILVVDPDEVPRSAQVVGEVAPHKTGERVVIS
jgi:phosphoribosylformylglycinamidine cyclo-ligase